MLTKEYSQLSPCGHPLLRTLAIMDTKRRPESVRYNES